MLNININDLSKNYGEKEVLKNIDMTIVNPGVYLIAGPNGSGKTTLLEIIVGLRDYDNGSVNIGAVNHGSVEPKRHVGFLAQQNSLRKSCTVLEEVRLVRDLYRLNVDIPLYLSKFNLDEYLYQKTYRLSGGTKRRLLIAMTLMPEHDIIILDEPASGLDTMTRDEIWNCIREYGRHNIVLVSDHYLNEAAQYSDHVYLINKGNIVLQGRTKQILSDFKMQYVIKTRSELVDSVKTMLLQFCDDYQVRLSGTVCNVFIKSDSEKIKGLLAKIGMEHDIRLVDLEDIYFYFTGDAVRDEVGSFA